MKIKNFFSRIDQYGLVLLLIIIFQPISDFIKVNINDQVFSLTRSLTYYLIFIGIFLICLFLLKLIFNKTKTLYFSLFYSLFVLFSFNYYLVNKIPIVERLNESAKGEFVFAAFTL